MLIQVYVNNSYSNKVRKYQPIAIKIVIKYDIEISKKNKITRHWIWTSEQRRI